MVNLTCRFAQKYTYIRRCIIILLTALLCAFRPVDAMAMDKMELMIGMKTLPLLNNKMTGNIKIAIMFDPARADSEKEAEDVKAIIDSGLDLPGDLTAEGQLVPVTQLDKIEGTKIAVITSNLDAYYNKISAVAGNYSILTMSTDLECVRQNKCILGIVSKPRVEIYYSRRAAENAKISFGQAFSALIKAVP